jgi:hypothetical protein
MNVEQPRLTEVIASCAGQSEMVHARFLTPLAKARGFRMTIFKTRAKLTHHFLIALIAILGDGGV